MIRKILLIMSIWVLPCLAQETPSPEPRYPNDARELYILARNLWAPVELAALNYQPSLEPLSASARLHQSCLFLQAAAELDPHNTLVTQDLTTLLMSDVINDPGRGRKYYRLYRAIRQDNQGLMEDWLSYRLTTLDDRETREYYLQTQLNELKNYPFLQSKIQTQLGIFALEKGDAQTASAYFNNAYSVSPYNDDALARLLEMLRSPVPAAGASPESMAQAQAAMLQTRQVYTAVYWRLKVLKNPYDVEAMLSFIEAVENHGSYEYAQKFYPHVYRLLKMEPALGELESEILFKQLLGAYSGKLYNVSESIAQTLLANKPDDLLVNALLAKSLQNLGQPDQARQIMDQAVKSTREYLAAAQPPDYERETELAWFLCFVDPQPALALEHAVHVHAGQSEDPRNKSILAYALTLNGNIDQAETLLKTADPNDPVSAFGWAKVHLARNDTAAALQVLKNMDPAHAGILAQQSRELIAELEKPTTETATAPAADSAVPPAPATDILVANIEQRFTNYDLQMVEQPARFAQCSLKVNKDIFNPAEPLECTLYLANVSDAQKIPVPLVLGPGCFIDPHVLLLAEVPAAQNRAVSSAAGTRLLAHRYLMASPVLMPGRSVNIREILNISLLHDIFYDYPQRECKITIYALLDPIPDGRGGYVGKVAEIQPRPVTITRRAFVPDPDKMNFQMRLLRQGSPAERINATQLFAALLREQQLAQRGQIDYAVRKIDTAGIRQALFANLAHSDFRVRAWTVYACRSLAPGSEQERIRLTELLSDSHWFVRFMTLYTLHEVADLTEYLDWASTIEENDLVKRLMQWQRGETWPIEEIPLQMPATASPPK